MVAIEDIDLNKAYKDFELVKAEVSGRGESTRKLERALTIVIVLVVLTFVSTILYVLCGMKWDSTNIEQSQPVVHQKAPKIAQVIDDEVVISQKETTETLHYSLAEEKKAIDAAWIHNVSMQYERDTVGTVIGYSVQYPINIKQETEYEER